MVPTSGVASLSFSICPATSRVHYHVVAGGAANLPGFPALVATGELPFPLFQTMHDENGLARILSHRLRVPEYSPVK